MSERPTQTRTSSATEADRLQLDARAGRGDVRPTVDLGQSAGQSAGQSLADRAAQFRNGAPFLVERATLYDPDPLELPTENGEALPPSRSLLPAALTLLCVVIVVGLAAGVIFVRNADTPRHDEFAGRLEQFSERSLPKSGDGASRRDAVPYDLTRRPTDTIVGAWRPPMEADDHPSGDGGTATPDRDPSEATKRRALPRRFSAAPPPPRVPEAGQTAPPAEIVSARPTEAPPADAIAKVEAAPTAAVSPPPTTTGAADRAADRTGPNVVARVGRSTEPAEGERQTQNRDAAPVPRRRDIERDEDDDAEPRQSSPLANRMSLSRYRAWRARRARLRAKRPDPYDAYLAEKAVQGIGFYGVHRQSP